MNNPKINSHHKGSLETVGNPSTAEIRDPGFPSTEGSRKKKRKTTDSKTRSLHGTPRCLSPASLIQPKTPSPIGATTSPLPLL